MRRARPSSFAPCRKTMAWGLPFATVCLRPPVELVGIRRFIQIFDASLVDKRAQCAVPHFDRIAVIPLDRALDLLPIFQHENHHGSAVNLLLKVERLGVRAFPAYCCGIRPCVAGERRRDRGHAGRVSPGCPAASVDVRACVGPSGLWKAKSTDLLHHLCSSPLPDARHKYGAPELQKNRTSSCYGDLSGLDAGCCRWGLTVKDRQKMACIKTGPARRRKNPVRATAAGCAACLVLPGPCRGQRPQSRPHRPFARCASARPSNRCCALNGRFPPAAAEGLRADSRRHAKGQLVFCCPSAPAR